MAYSILEEDWSDYDDKKVRDKRDARFFACTEAWEVDYLKRKIKLKYPDLDEQMIIKAIQLCCQDLKTPHPRRPFVECVGRRLRLSLAG